MTNTNETYNGWSNRSTWLATLWLENEESTHRQFEEAVKASDIPALKRLLKQTGFRNEQNKDEKAINWKEIIKARQQ